MKQFYFSTILLILGLFCISSLLAQVDTTYYLEEILVTGNDESSIFQTNISSETLKLQDVHDVGEMFKQQVGFGIVKRGNYAMEPVLRGFKYEQLNVQFDGGSKTSNACPNRMDPAISQVSPEEVEKAEIIKGPYSVRFGPSFGGLINIVTIRPEKVNSFKVKGSLEGGYMSNGGNYYGQANVMLLSKNIDVSLHGDYKDFGDYKSGDGTTIPSSFSRWSYAVKIGNNHGKNKQNRIQLTWRQGFASDILHAGLPMDADFDDNSQLYIDYMANDLSPLLFSLKAKVYASVVDHQMSTRNRPSWSITEAVTPVNSKSTGGRIEFGLKPAKKLIQYIGLDYSYINKDGSRERLVKINGCTGDTLPQPKSFTDKGWQDSKMQDIGLFFENKFSISPQLLWIIGLRLDLVSYAIDDPSPDFAELYNNDIQPDNDLNLSVNTSLSWNIDQSFQLQLALGRGLRSASLSEKFINHFSIGLDAYEYVGDPHLKPEENYQADIVVSKKWKIVHVYADVFYSYMNNFISAFVDTTLNKKFMQCKPPAHAKRFTNVDKSMMTGFEAGINIFFAKYFEYNLSGGYTYAQNISWDEPLPEIPPFKASTALIFKSKKVNAELRGRYSAKQDRISTSFSESTSPDYFVSDIAASYSPFEFMEIRGSVTNLFDANYADHLSRAYKNMGAETGSLYYEPGRSFNLSLRFIL